MDELKSVACCYGFTLESADCLLATGFTTNEIKGILNELFPVTEKTTEREKATIDKIKDEYMVCYFAPDIMKFQRHGLGCHQCHQRPGDPQYAPPEHQELSGKQLE